MMTLARFKTLVDSYGGEPGRWPENLRGAAEALARTSPEARALLDEARILDDAIEVAGAWEAAAIRQPGEAAAALARLRAGIGARIAQPSIRRRRVLPFGWADALAAVELRWLAMVAGGGIAVAVGLMIGASSLSAPGIGQDAFVAMLQPAPLHILAD